LAARVRRGVARDVDRVDVGPKPDRRAQPARPADLVPRVGADAQLLDAVVAGHADKLAADGAAEGHGGDVVVAELQAERVLDGEAPPRGAPGVAELAGGDEAPVGPVQLVA